MFQGTKKPSEAAPQTDEPSSGNLTHRYVFQETKKPRRARALDVFSTCALSAQLGKILQHAQPVGLALLGVELGGEEVVAPDHGAEGLGVVGRGGDDVGVARHDVVGMDEVDVRALAEPFEDRGPARDGELVPAHVRHGVLRRKLEPDDLARQHAQALVFAVLVALVEQQLQAEADAQERLARVDGRKHRLDEVALAEFGHGVFKRPDAGQHDLVGPGDVVRVAGHGRLVPDLLEPLLDTPQVAHSVVDDGDHIDLRTSGDSRATNGSPAFAEKSVVVRARDFRDRQ